MVYILYRPNSEHERRVMELKTWLERRRIRVELVDVDSRSGASKAQVYGIMQYPAVLAARESNGQAIQTWQGEVPTVADVEFFAKRDV